MYGGGLWWSFCECVLSITMLAAMISRLSTLFWEDGGEL